MKHSRSSHPPSDTAFSPALRRLVWLNIAVQSAFPLAVAFTPAMAGAGEQHFLQQPAPLFALRTQVYTLGTGETATSVAKKYNLTISQLRELNQFRTFSNSFDGLKSGDEIDVPLTPFPKVQWHETEAATDAKEQNNNEQAQKLAGYASQAGGFLAGSAKSDTAASMVRGMATSEASEAFQQWLSHFGTARVQLEADKNFSLKSSQFDLLMPLYDRGDNLAFTQGGLRRADSRIQANLGAGWRYFTPTYMLGGNLFGDYDLSRDHARMGVGLEYWRDFLKVGANGYMRLTGWKESPDLADYQVRPANGWDIRAQAWVPSLPQLGGKLTYEQYYGKEVALFGVDNRQKNPQAVTAGINYTPVPLITLGAEQRQGQSGKNDARLTLDMNYLLGVPWRAQVDPTAVAAMRSLTGSRYDLVERNNNIVLEYRKKKILRLHTADLITGQAGEQKSLGVSVTSTYGLSHIDWEASTLIAAGGKIVQNGSDYAVVLPTHQTSTRAVNSYTVSAVAVDKKGNRSDRSDTQVTVLALEVSRQTSTFTPVSSVLPADGKSTQVLTLTLRDENNQVLDIDVKDISLKNSSLKSASVSVLTRKSAGVYTITVTAGTDNETVTLAPLVSGITLSPVGVTIISSTPDEKTTTIVTDKTSYASGEDMTVTVTLRDASDNAVTGGAPSLTPDTVTVAGATPKGSWTDNGDGIYTATYTAVTAGANLKAAVRLSGWSGSAESAAYAIMLSEAPASINTQVNVYTFTQTSEEGTFPTTGFTGATFTLVLKDSKSAADYSWKSDASWVSVTDGVVTFTGTGNGSKVTIIGTPTSGKGEIIKYSFTLKSWFINSGEVKMNQSEANTYCSSQSGYSQPTVAQMSLHNNYSPTRTRGTGALWNEWGNLNRYTGSFSVGTSYWSSEQGYYIYVGTGHIGSNVNIGYTAACRQGF